MSAAWKDLPFAPAEGQKLCAAGDLTGPVNSFDLDGFPLLLVQTAEGLRGYVNACPHQYLPLDWRSDRILSGDGRVLRCSNHAAGFDACTGAGLDGHGAGCQLDAVPIAQADGFIVIGSA